MKVIKTRGTGPATEIAEVINNHEKKRTMARKERHVVPGKDGGWDSKRENAERASKHFETKEDAMKWSREKSSEEGSELIPHRKDGTIQNPDSHGNDPFPPKG